MFEKENQALDMRGLKFAVDAVKRMRHRMRDRFALQIGLELEDVFTRVHDVRVLRFRYSPNQKVNLAGIVREISRDLFADEGVRQIGNLKAALDAVVIGDGDEIHPFRAQRGVKIFWMRIAVGKIEAAKKPFFRALAEARMNVKIAAAHSISDFGMRISERRSAIQSR